jgi:hypothetical protein
MSETGDTDALAAEYALGTLDGPERAQAQAMLGVDQAFAAKVRLWERRLGELHLMVEPVEPDGEIWHRIKSKVPEPAPAPEVPAPEIPAPAAEIEAAKEPAPAVPPSAPAEAAAAAVSEPSSSAETVTASPVTTPPIPSVSPVTPDPSPVTLVPTSPVTPITLPPAPGLELPLTPAPLTPARVPSEPVAPPESLIRAPIEERADDSLVLRRRLRRWRAFAVLLVLLLLAIGVLVAAWRYAPDRVPERLRAVELLRLVGITLAPPPAPAPVPTRPPAPPESQFDE